MRENNKLNLNINGLKSEQNFDSALFGKCIVDEIRFALGFQRESQLSKKLIMSSLLFVQVLVQALCDTM